ncbi:conserved exported hypothetical protein [Candidatus Nitrotoga sp. HW29]|uniref:right-handed parallel beta-helix repeat-containing protein n=1 Tax=Candidatus Nitrotoga sp. HW29 TaxID=2886963 RepID=UPI001EF3B908|nr:right-handed parallel beta-helix repeat-containing protein [Candidatus Nitrotoga sp. HW29]CAH1906360.1 conserved exported hypothetical protein [Candidatus Nitrotoga sp. HW29]
MFRFPVIYLIAVLCTILVPPAQAAQRAFVASYGSDSNSCVILSPCRTFAQAMTVVDPNGEVVVLDSAGYGSVTLTQSVSLIAAPGIYAGIAVFSGTSGVTIGTPNVNIVLRGLTINSQDGNAGILMTAGANGAKLSIENCVISNFSIIASSANQYGVLVQAAATVRMVNTLIRDNDIGIQLEAGATADISGSKFFGNSTYGVVAYNYINGTTTTAAISDTVVSQGGGVGIFAIVDSASTAIARAEIVRSIVSNYNEGVRAESQNGAASISIRKSMVTGSSNYGLGQLGIGATMTSYGNNTLSNNSSNLFGTLTTASPL